jgi:hypothetical protein
MFEKMKNVGVRPDALCFSLFSITSLFWEHVSFTKPWDMSWLILKFKILKFYMYLLDISVYIGEGA